MPKSLLFLAGFFLVGCAAHIVPTVYEPMRGEKVVTAYANGIPVISFMQDSLGNLFYLEYTRVAGGRYFRLWLLTYNASSGSYLLDPTNSVSLLAIEAWGRDTLQQQLLLPELPSLMLAKIEDQEQAAQIANLVGGVLSAAAGNKHAGIETRIDFAATSTWFSLYKSSISSGILRKNTVFPGASVNGYVYFKANLKSKSNDYYGGMSGDNIREKFTFQVIFQLPSGQRKVSLVPVKGE
jgi:hypothetical protein